jgi:hypothetical protein
MHQEYKSIGGSRSEGCSVDFHFMILKTFLAKNWQKL